MTERVTLTVDNQLLDKYIAAWNSGDSKSVMSCFADDILFEDVALNKSMTYEALASFVRGTFDDFTDLRFEKVSVCFDGTCVAWEWRMIGTHKNGQAINIPGMSMTEFENGKIIRNRDYWSTSSTQ